MMIWQIKPGTDLNLLGLIPGMVKEADNRKAAEQFDSNYAHGGGWRPMPTYSCSNRSPDVSMAIR